MVGGGVLEVWDEVREVLDEVREVLDKVREVLDEVREVLDDVREVLDEVREVWDDVREDVFSADWVNSVPDSAEGEVSVCSVRSGSGFSGSVCSGRMSSELFCCVPTSG